MQPGGHRFDPGQLHQILCRLQDCGETGVNHIMDRIVGLGPMLIPIIAILVGGAIAITAMVLKHHERIAKIERGVDPDGPWPQK